MEGHKGCRSQRPVVWLAAPVFKYALPVLTLLMPGADGNRVEWVDFAHSHQGGFAIRGRPVGSPSFLLSACSNTVSGYCFAVKFPAKLPGVTRNYTFSE